MAGEGFKRKLTAILSADVVGYSRLMVEDEETTVQTLTTYRDIITNLIKSQNGRVADAKGDNILAEFVSVVDAVRCAVEVQRELKKQNNELADHRKMKFRIGINLGDIIDEKDTIYGDGVNIAARLEGLAHPGGICISGTAYDHVKNKLDLGYEYLGKQTVKNIPDPVRVYRVLIEPEYAGRIIGEERPKPRLIQSKMVVTAAVIVLVAGSLAIWNFYFRRASIESASVEKMAYPLPTKPSIAVLPFENLSGDPKQEYLSDGISEAVISALSKVPKMFVIARNSSFAYKGKSVKVQQVAEELGVQYVLEGSVQRSGEKLRVTAQLIDALKGHHLWSERYDLKMDDLLAVQDKIAMNVLVETQVKLTDGEQARLLRKETNNLKAYEKYLEGVMYYFRTNREDNFRARQLFEEAIVLDSNFSGAYRGVAASHLDDLHRGWSQDPGKSFQLATEYAQKALALDENNSSNLRLWGAIHTAKGDHEKAIELCRRAVEINPNDAATIAYLAGALFNAGRYQETIPLWEKAGRLNPLPSVVHYRNLGLFYWFTGRYMEAIAVSKKALQINPDDITTFKNLAAIYAALGNEEEARAAAAEVLRLDPNFSIERYFKNMPWKDREGMERFMDALRKAGLPEHPPLPLPDKPSIAVLAFENMSGDPEQEYFSDGLSEEIITALSKTPKLFVIARNSSFTYKGKPTKVQQIGRELGVKYILEGSVRKSGDRVRITVQLVDAKTGKHLWADRYDRELKDIFALQDEITFKVIAALQVKLTDGEQALITAWGTNNFEAYAKFLQGMEYARRFNGEGNLLARKMAEEVIASDPGYPQGYRLLGGTHMMDVWFGLTKSPRKSLAEAVRLFQKVIAMYPSAAITRGLLGIVYTMMRQHEKGIAELEKAIALNPNVADNHAWFGFVLHLNGRHKEALVEIKKAIRLNPFPRSFYFMYLGNAYMYERMYDESIAAYKKALRVQPNNLFPHLRLAAVYSLLDREQEARAAAAEALKIVPKFSLERFAKTVPFKNQADTKHLINALRKAGLK